MKRLFALTYDQKNSCPHCGSFALCPYGSRKRKLFTRKGWECFVLSRFKCSSCRYHFHPFSVETIGMFAVEMIEYVAFMYLRALSFNAVIDIMRAWFDKKVLSKDILIDHIEQLTDRLPSHDDITAFLKPKRSGYYALDGTWLKYRGRDFVLLILFDVITLDLVSWVVAREETQDSYQQLIDKAKTGIATSIKGLFCDGDPGLLAALKLSFPSAPIQLCVFHKYCRVGQIIPFVRIKNEIDREIKDRVEQVLFSLTKEKAVSALHDLEAYAQEHQKHKQLHKVIGILQRNFDLLLTHFDHSEMSPYNNVLEGFNHIIKRRLRLMKGFKKPINIQRWLKLILLDWRFHSLKESVFKDRKGKSPLQLAECQLPVYYNWMKFVRLNYPKV